MIPLMQMFDTVIATDEMPDDQHAELLAIDGAKFIVDEAGHDAGWVEVARNVTARLSAEGYTTILSVLDDFLFFSIDEQLLSRVANQIDEKQLHVVRLVAEKPRLRLLFSGQGQIAPDLTGLRIIPSDNPYRHSLSLSLWNVNYFERLLAADISIWDFETQRPEPDAHLYYTPMPPCRYNHIVEKGRYGHFVKGLPNAPSKLGCNRVIETATTRVLRWFRSDILFFFLGYTIANWRFNRASTTSKP